mmetsp:Transcript_24042/g.34928  ORF Transcript_24042/g.34928 Transcript_24042/m.34928 type:complete len:332 (+) Transcript_24042:123-1118(+)
MQHAHHAGPLAVADGVKHLLHLRSMVNRHLDRVRSPEGIQPEGCAQVVVDELLPHLPLREEGVRGVGLGPGGEPLVEPEVVPPLHGHQVAEPLVGQLVGHHGAHPLLLLAGGLLLVNEQVYLAVGHQAPVLHGTHGKLGDGHHVQLGQGVRHLEEVVVEVQAPAPHVQGELARLGLPRGRVHAHEHVVLGVLLHKVKLAHADGDQVRGHLWGGHEHHLLAAILQGVDLLLRHVAEGGEVLGHHNGELKAGLQGRLVPAGEALAGVQGLKLSGSHIFGLAIDVCVFTAVETSHLVVEVSHEANRKNTFSDRDGVNKYKSQGLELGVENCLCR